MVQSYLEIETAAGRKQLVLGNGSVRVGRHQDNQIVLTDAKASRFHCAIEKIPQGYRIKDLGSSNGTLLNGRPVTTALLRAGDVVTIGQTRLILVLPGGSKASSVGRAPAAKTHSSPKPAPESKTPTGSKNPPASPSSPAPPDLLPDSESPESLPLSLDELEDLAKPAHVEDAELEGLSDEDLVEVEGDEPADFSLALEPEGDLDEYAAQLAKRVRALPDPWLHSNEINILNPRGQIVAENDPASRDGDSQVDLLRRLIVAGLRSRSTDLHIEPHTDHYQVRLRVDGVLVDVLRLPADVGARVVGVAKVIADVDPAQRNIIQEGHFSAQVPTRWGNVLGPMRRVDYRLSFAPTVYGQKLVVRILDAATAPARLEALGLPPDVRDELAKAIEHEAGMILVCGPTGSGKTSTLYALIRSLNLRERNVVTIEDPVEILLEHATQIPVDEKHDNTFPNLLRSVLRQDPDVILVGEIRDEETARTAIQAAITGHLVFSTVHTRDSAGTVFRLLDLGVEPYMMAQGLQLVLAQRLVRQLCRACKRSHPITPEERQKMGSAADGVEKIWEPRGCARCLGTGFSGRRAFYELLIVNQPFREAISHTPSLREVTQILAAAPFRRLLESGYQLVAAGVVSIDEVEKAVGR